MHIADKKTLFSKLHTWLKPNSRILIADYCLGTTKSTPDHKQHLEKMKFNLISTDEYLKLLSSAGFSNITSTDRTTQLIQYISEDLQKAEENKDDFMKVLTCAVCIVQNNGGIRHG